MRTIRSAVSWWRGGGGGRSLLAEDLRNGTVTELSMDLVGAKRMEEPEHGGLICFLRSSDDRVIVLYDYDSQDITIRGDDPAKSAFQPRGRLTVVRAPKAGQVVDATFDGDILDPGDALPLTAPPDQWPDDGAFCDIPWHDLERRFSG